MRPGDEKTATILRFQDELTEARLLPKAPGGPAAPLARRPLAVPPLPPEAAGECRLLGLSPEKVADLRQVIRLLAQLPLEAA